MLNEFLNIIMKVQHQNDFEARAALLAVLGGIAQHVVGRRSVGNLIRRSLDSHDIEEQLAAIWAAEQLVKVDGEFAHAIVGQVTKMLHDPAVPVHLHSKLLSVLGQCHSSAATDVLESIKKLLSGSILKNPVSGSDHAFSIDCCRIGITKDSHHVIGGYHSRLYNLVMG